MSQPQTGLVAETLRLALLDAARRSGDDRFTSAFGQAAAALAGAVGDRPAAHPALPVTGSSMLREFVVADPDTAAAMGHPDPEVRVLASPRLALWFEIVASTLVAEPSPEITHVGVGILVHHLNRADIGELVTVRVRVDEIDGRRVVFSGEAMVGSRLVALATHQRVVLEAR
ncbi:MAG: thioesterase family protein [Acidimicrobiales bacterium]